MRRRTIAALVAVLSFPASVLVAGEVLSHPAQGSVGLPPSDLPATSISIRLAEGGTVSGWMVHGKPGAGAILLLHGVRADRRQMLGRARFLHRLGYSVLLIDLPAHGESSGAHITYGVTEAHGVSAAIAYLSHELPAEKVGVIGVSLGAASLVLSKPDSTLSAVVLESMFPTIREAVSDRLNIYLGQAGEVLTPLLLWQLPLRLAISPDQIRPIDALHAVRAPLLIAAGSIDRHTTLAETERIYAAAAEPKALWIVDGAAHVDLHAFDPKVYEARVSAFLAEHLRGTSNPGRRQLED